MYLWLYRFLNTLLESHGLSTSEITGHLIGTGLITRASPYVIHCTWNWTGTSMAPATEPFYQFRFLPIIPGPVYSSLFICCLWWLTVSVTSRERAQSSLRNERPELASPLGAQLCTVYAVTNYIMKVCHLWLAFITHSCA